jgi:uncharacterized protein involved in tolerance to divalent cations
MSAPHTTTTAPPVSHALLKYDLGWVVTRIDKYAREEIEKKTALIYLSTNDENDTDIHKHNLKAMKKKLETCRDLWMQGLASYYKNTAEGDEEVRRLVKSAKEKLSIIRPFDKQL